MTYSEAKSKLLAELAESKGLSPDDMRAWVNYDPISIDEEAHHLARGSSATRWTGD